MYKGNCAGDGQKVYSYCVLERAGIVPRNKSPFSLFFPDESPVFIQHLAGAEEARIAREELFFSAFRQNFTGELHRDFRIGWLESEGVGNTTSQGENF
jgi:hypothetical protein